MKITPQTRPIYSMKNAGFLTACFGWKNLIDTFPTFRWITRSSEGDFLRKTL